MFRILVAVVMICNLCSLAFAQSVELDLTGAVPGSKFVVSVNADGKTVTVRPLGQSVKLADLSSNPTTPPTNPPPTGPSALEAKVEAQARNSIGLGGSLTTGAAFSEVYGLVSDGVSNGTIDAGRSLEAANMGTAYILSKATDAQKWVTFELLVRNELQVLDSQGKLKTKEDYAKALREVSNGLNRATGHKTIGAKLATLDLSTNAKVVAAVKANGILDGIDLVKLMEWIKFIMDLFKLFAPK